MNEKKKVKLSVAILFYLTLFLVSFVFLSVFSYYTSPFTTCDNGYDAAFFRLVGQGMTKGYLPYRDLQESHPQKDIVHFQTAFPVL